MEERYPGVTTKAENGTARSLTPEEQQALDEVMEYETRRIGEPAARAWVESHVELILAQARMMGEL